MITRFFKKNKFKHSNLFVEPDEIFLDSHNLANFDQQQFEGRIEKPINKKTIYALGILFFLILGIFGARLSYLQIKKGEAYLARSENNTLDRIIIFADRGIIYDRNQKELAWNINDEILIKDGEQTIKEEDFPIRTYLTPGFSHILGYVSSPSKDKTGRYWQTEYVGKDGLEKQYDSVLRGKNGSNIIETDAHGAVYSENAVDYPKRGNDLTTSIDSRVQTELYNLIKSSSEIYSFTGGAGVIMDVENGEIIASTSYPEYDSQILSLGQDSKKIGEYATDKRKVYLDRTISGLYTPGSIVKPFLAFGALAEGIIDPTKSIFSAGFISIPNPYDETKPTIFKDWRAHGWTDMSEALAVSSDVYFYAIGGGYQDQKGLGIANIEKYSRLFGIGEMTGVDLPDEKSGNIPNPEWKLKAFKGDPWRLGDTYHTAIGQYGFQVTPMEMVRATGALANGGKLLTPHFVLGINPEITRTIDMPKSYFDEIHQGMRETVTSGTASGLNVPYVKVAAKTGTAQLGALKNRVNSWVIGFFPYDKPKYAFTVMMESGPSTGTVGASSIMRGLFDKMYWETPEYFGLPPWPEKVEEVIEVTPPVLEVIEIPTAELEIPQ